MSAPADPTARTSSTSRWLGLVGFVVGLLPLVLNWHQLSRLFWFGDEWDLMDQILREGWGTWVWRVFAENFVPLFKILWSGVLWLGGGDFRVALVTLWLTHALNTALLGRWLHAGGVGLAGCLLAQIIFGLSSTNLETLGWTVQWSAVLATTFLLVVLLRQQREQTGDAEPTWRQPVGWAVLVLASAWCFSRGVLTGGLAALGCLWLPGGSAAPWRRRIRNAAICILPAAATALLIMGFAEGNLGHLGGHHADVGLFALWYWGMNPLHGLLGWDTEGVRTLALLLAGKLLVMGYGWRAASPSQRRVLAFALLFDLGNAVLLGIGRYHTGLPATLSSRYQYGSLLGFLPFAAVAFTSLAAVIPARFQVRTLAAAAALTLLAWHCAVRWRTELPPFVTSRGEASRAVLTQPDAPGCSVPGIPFLSCDRARELGREFKLH